MEYIPGGTLDQRLPKSRKEAVALFDDGLDELAAEGEEIGGCPLIMSDKAVDNGIHP